MKNEKNEHFKPTGHQVKIFFLFAVFAAGTFLFHPYLNFQTILSQGDHGRDLYCFKQTMDGAVPYRDYWWVYGPLMPYYYGLCYKIFGVHITSVLLGNMLLKLLAGIFLYLSLSIFIVPSLAGIATLWFWTFFPDFFFTYNHTAGTAVQLILIYCLFLYIKKPLNRYIFYGLCSVFVLAAIKINIGIFTLIAFLASLGIIDAINKNLSPRRIRIYALSSLILLSSIAVVYWTFLHGLPLYYIRQCFPFLKAGYELYSPVWNSLQLYWHLLIFDMTMSWAMLSFGALIIFSAVRFFMMLRQGSIDIKLRNQLILLMISLAIFFILNLHEFLNSGVLYRSMWTAPFKILAIFLILGISTQHFPAVIRLALSGTLLLTIFLENNAQVQGIKNLENPRQYLAFQTAQIYVGNSPDWVEVVKQTAQYLTETLKRDETFIAIPYDPLYYFLTGKSSPTRQLIFFYNTYIPPEQENEIIAQLDGKKVNYVVLSSRSDNTYEAGLGVFGKTHCTLLARYITDHFKVIATFGNWQKEPGWAWNHGTKILKRISSRKDL